MTNPFRIYLKVARTVALCAGLLCFAASLAPAAALAVAPGSTGPALFSHLNDQGPSLATLASPASADTSATITVSGGLSEHADTCWDSGDPHDATHDRYYSTGGSAVVGAAAEILDGPFAGKSIPVAMTTPEQDANDGGGNGSANCATIYPAFQEGLFAGSATFDTAGLQAGTYTMHLKVTDNYEGESVTVPVVVTVAHGPTPAPGHLGTSCSATPAAGAVGAPIVWSSHASMGGGSGQELQGVTYTWRFDDGSSASGATVSKTFGAPGTEHATVTATYQGAPVTNTCTATIAATGPASDLSCAASAATANVGDELTFTATGGMAPFSWISNFGSPASSTGSTFLSAFTQPGYRAVKVTDGADPANLARCFVTVGGTGSITIGSNVPTTWTLSSAAISPPLSQTYAAATATYKDLPIGAAYVLSVAPAVAYQGVAYANPLVYPDTGSRVSGVGKPVTLSQSLLKAGDTLIYNVVYAASSTSGPAKPGAGTPTLAISPAMSEIQIPSGATPGQPSEALLTAWYDPTGADNCLGLPTPAACEDVTSGAAWSSADPGVVVFEGMSHGPADFHAAAAGTTQGIAAYQGLTAQAAIKVDSAPPPPLSAILTPAPSDGTAPLAVTLSAAVASQPYVQGTLNYTFWKHCTYWGTSVAVASEPQNCGAPDDKYDGTFANPQATKLLTYPNPGIYDATVIVEQGGYAVNAQAVVAVHPAQTPLPGPTHAECVSNSCVQVNGVGPNRCGTNADCGGSSAPGTPFGGVCDAAAHACVNKAGSGTTCDADPACHGAGVTHLECENQSCVIVGGPGSDSCARVGSSCNMNTPPPGPGGAGLCTFAAAPRIISAGESSMLTWSCTGSLKACTVTDDGTGAIVKSAGPSGSAAVSPSQTTVYDLNCDEGSFSTSTTVHVVHYQEIPPR
jgi:hypothetical protein